MQEQSEQQSSAIMLLLQRLSDSQIDQGRALSKTAEDQHEIKMSLAVLTARLESLPPLTKEITELSMATHRHRDQIEANGLKIRTLEGQVLELTSQANKRSGWETLGGKMVYVLGAGIFGTLCTLVVQGLSP
jgi:chromosome segregation ATPase